MNTLTRTERLSSINDELVTLMGYIIKGQEAEIPAIQSSFLIGAQAKLSTIIHKLSGHDAEAYKPVIHRCQILSILIQDYLNNSPELNPSIDNLDVKVVALPKVYHDGAWYFVDFNLEEIRDPQAIPTPFTEINDDDTRKKIRGLRAGTQYNYYMDGLDGYHMEGLD